VTALDYHSTHCLSVICRLIISYILYTISYLLPSHLSQPYRLQYVALGLLFVFLLLVARVLCSGG
jgi:hypothetical protein